MAGPGPGQGQDGEGDRLSLPNGGRPTLLDIVTNPDEVSLPPKTKPGQAWGFAIAKLKETL